MANDVSPVLAVLARSRYAARGVVYVLVGGSTALSAIGIARSQKSPKEALTSLLGDTGSELLLAIIAAGLIAFSIWRLIQSLLDTDRHGADGRGLAVRAGLLMSAMSYGFMGFYAIALLAGWATGNNSQQSWANRLMHWPLGLWLIAGAGLIIVVVGLAHFAKGARAGFEKHLQMDDDLFKVLKPVCQFGLLARGVVFVIVGGFFLLAAATGDSSDIGGTAKALDWLTGSTLGWTAMLIVAVGLFAFGLYSLIESSWRRVVAPT